MNKTKTPYLDRNEFKEELKLFINNNVDYINTKINYVKSKIKKQIVINSLYWGNTVKMEIHVFYWSRIDRSHWNIDL